MPSSRSSTRSHGSGEAMGEERNFSVMIVPTTRGVLKSSNEAGIRGCTSSI